jgi:hypothetical protein
MSTTPATGVTGHLLDNFDGTYCFRVYGKNHTFIDYDLRHCDLTVTIVDKDATFYSIDGVNKLDHNPETLGIEE